MLGSCGGAGGTRASKGGKILPLLDFGSDSSCPKIVSFSLVQSLVEEEVNSDDVTRSFPMTSHVRSRLMDRPRLANYNFCDQQQKKKKIRTSKFFFSFRATKKIVS